MNLTIGTGGSTGQIPSRPPIDLIIGALLDFALLCPIPGSAEETQRPAEEIQAPAPGTQQPLGMITDLTGFDLNKTGFMQTLGLNFGGWLSAGVTVNRDQPSSHFNGPVTFNDRSNDVLLNQFNLFLERATNKEGDRFDLGFRAEAMVGTDPRFVHATGLDDKIVESPQAGGPRFYNFALPQLYVEGFVPVGKGLSVKAGRFYTLFGAEVAPATGNFFYSHSYTFQYGEPFTHTGALGAYPLTKNLTINAGAVMGWDNWSENSDRWGGIGGGTYTSDDKNTSVALYANAGDDTTPGTPPGHNRWLYTLVLTQKFLEKFTYVFQHDHGSLENGAPNGIDTATWYGLNNYLFYDVTDKLAGGLRLEWFHDSDGVRVCNFVGDRNPGPTCPSVRGDFYELTAGLNWKPKNWLAVRPEVRYDWAGLAAPAGGRPFNDGLDKDQFLFAVDMVAKF